jgi:hypothetical protein
MELQPVISSNVKAAGFEKDRMQIQFNSGATYEAQVTQADFDAFMSSKSKGSHFAKVLKKAFAWSKIEKKG